MYLLKRKNNFKMALYGFFRYYSNRKRTHYEVLNLPYTCSDGEIREAFAKMSKKFHPDINKGGNTESEFQRIVEAYNVLGKPRTRLNYDNQIQVPKNIDFDVIDAKYKKEEAKEKRAELVTVAVLCAGIFLVAYYLADALIRPICPACQKIFDEENNRNLSLYVESRDKTRPSQEKTEKESAEKRTKDGSNSMNSQIRALGPAAVYNFKQSCPVCGNPLCTKS